MVLTITQKIIIVIIDIAKSTAISDQVLPHYNLPDNTRLVDAYVDAGYHLVFSDVSESWNLLRLTNGRPAVLEVCAIRGRKSEQLLIYT